MKFFSLRMKNILANKPRPENRHFTTLLSTLFILILAMQCGKSPLGEPPLSADGFTLYKNNYASQSDGGMKAALEEVIDSTTERLDCAISRLTQNSVIGKILVKAQQSGVKIRIAFDEDVYGTDTGAQALASSGLFAINAAGKNSLHYGNKGDGVMRHNFCTSDEKYVYISTAAFDDHQMTRLPNVAIKIGSSKFGLPREFLKEVNMFSERLFGSGKGKLDFATKFTALDQVIGLYWGPQESPVDVLSAELADARKTIEFYSTSFQTTSTRSDKDLPQTLRRLEANKGVSIRPVVTTQALFETGGKIGELNSPRQLAFQQTRIGANFIVMEKGTPQVRSFIYTGSLRSKANSADDGLLIVLKGERVADYLSSYISTMYAAGATINSTGTDITTADQREVIISEIMWMGSYDDTGAPFADDEFIELYNTTSSTINISRWKLGCTTDGSTTTDNKQFITLPDNATIAPGGFFVIGRKSEQAFRYADWLTPRNILTNSSVQCILTDGDTTAIPAFSGAVPTFTGTIVDRAGDGTTTFSSGAAYGLDDSIGKVRRSMERKHPIADGTLASSWKTNTLTSIRNENVAAGYAQKTFASPGATNVYFQLEQVYPVSATLLRAHFSEEPNATEAGAAGNFCIAPRTATSCSSSQIGITSVSVSGKIALLTLSSAVPDGAYRIFAANIVSQSDSAALNPAYADFYDFRNLYLNSNATFEAFTGANPDNFTVTGLTSSQSSGISGNAVNLNGTLGSNGDVLTLANPANITKGTCAALAFYVKGTAGKNLVVQLDSSKYYNLNDLNLTGNAVLPSSSASFTGGSINTGGEWKRALLNIVTAANTSAFKFRAGDGVAYNLDIDQVHFENCEPDTAPPVVTSYTPAHGALFSTAAVNVSASFNKPMNTGTITTASLRVVPGADCSATALTTSGLVASDGDTTFTLTLNAAQLSAGISYSTCVENSVQSSNNINMSSQAIATWTAASPGSFNSDLIISEYAEGNSNNKYIEIYNGTGSTVNLDNYRLGLHSNMSTSTGSTLVFTSGTLLDTAKTWVLCNASIATNLQTACNQLGGTVTGFNGDDAIVLQKNINGNWVTIDIIGNIPGTDTGDGWLITAGTVCTGAGCTAGASTVDSILMRNAGVTDPTSDPGTSFGQWATSSASSEANILLNNGMGVRTGTSFVIISATSTSPTSVQVTFSDAPKTAQAETAGNYSIGSGALNVSAASLAGNTVTLTTASQTSGQTYTVTVTGVERNSNSQALTINAASFTGYQAPKVKSVVPVYGNVVDANFDKNMSAATIDAFPGRFTLTGGLTVSSAQLQTSGAHANKRVRLALTGNQTAGTSYTLTVNTAVTDTNSVNTDGSSNTGSFYGYSPNFGIMESNTAGFEGANASYYENSGGTLNNNTAEFYEGANSLVWSTLSSDTSCSGGRTARTIAYYPVTPGESYTASVFMKPVTVTGGGNVRGRLRLYWYQDSTGTASSNADDLDSGATSFTAAGNWTAHSQTFTAPSDAFYMRYQIHGCYSSPATSADQLHFDQAFFGQPAFRVLSATSTGNGTVQIVFSHQPTSGNGATGAANTANYAITNNGGLTVSGASLSGSTVTLTTSSQVSGTYTVTVSNVTRASDSFVLYANSATFSGTAIAAFNVNSAAATAYNKVTVTFSEDPTNGSATNAANYSIPGLTISAASLSGSTATLTTTAQTPNTAYTVTVSNVLRQLDNATLTTTTANFNGFWGLINGSFEDDTNSCSVTSRDGSNNVTGLSGTCPVGWTFSISSANGISFSSVAGTTPTGGGANYATLSSFTSSYAAREIRSTTCLQINKSNNLNISGWYLKDTANTTQVRHIIYYYTDATCTSASATPSTIKTGLTIATQNTWENFTDTVTTATYPAESPLYFKLAIQGSRTSSGIIQYDLISITNP